MRVRVLHAKLYAYALPGSTARQLFNSSTARQLDSSTARQLDRPRQTSTDLDAQAHGVKLDRLDKNSTVTRQARLARPRQHLDSASTAPRQRLDGASTARQLDSHTTARAQVRSCALRSRSSNFLGRKLERLLPSFSLTLRVFRFDFAFTILV